MKKKNENLLWSLLYVLVSGENNNLSRKQSCKNSFALHQQGELYVVFKWNWAGLQNSFRNIMTSWLWFFFVVVVVLLWLRSLKLFFCSSCFFDFLIFTLVLQWHTVDTLKNYLKERKVLRSTKLDKPTGMLSLVQSIIFGLIIIFHNYY